MSFVQLLSTRRINGGSSIVAEETTPTRSFRELETAGRSALLWGNTDLIAIAIELVQRKYRANHVSLLDQSLAPIDGLEDVVDRFLEAINQKDLSFANQIASNELFGTVFAFIRLSHGKPLYQSVEIHQNGTLGFDFAPEQETLNELFEVIARVS
jgi:hypothetical protein